MTPGVRRPFRTEIEAVTSAAVSLAMPVELRIALAGVNVAEEQQAAVMGGVEVDLVAAQTSRMSQLPPQGPCEVTVFSMPRSGAVKMQPRKGARGHLTSRPTFMTA